MKTGENRGWLHHSDRVVLLGSCFSDNIGTKMHGAFIDATVNPMGTLYNPMSIARGVQRLIECRARGRTGTVHAGRRVEQL